MSKLLIVDDDPLLIRMYQKKFDLDGYSVLTANNGEDGLKTAAEEKPDLILLDIMMPKMNGIDMLKKLKSESSTKSIPVILLTNVSGPQQDIDKGLELGAVTYLVKSNYTPKEIVEKVKELMSASVREIPKVKSKVKE